MGVSIFLSCKVLVRLSVTAVVPCWSSHGHFLSRRPGSFTGVKKDVMQGCVVSGEQKEEMVVLSERVFDYGLRVVERLS